MEQPLISICIPVYKRVDYLKRLLDSIEMQTFRRFEVIITDDSPDQIISDFIGVQNYNYSCRYFKNQPAKGTPLNWMEGMKYAKGDWIKIIHDDDWLTDQNSLQKYAEAISESVDCIFSGYIAHFEDSNAQVDKTISKRTFNKILEHPYYLFASNKIGPPSVLLFRKNIQEIYDSNLKWLVDLEAYIRMMNKYHCIYINSPLITMSYNETQVTNNCFRNPYVEIREALIYYRKHGSISHQRLLTYDAWWRLLRNLNIKEEKDLLQYSYGIEVPKILISILKFQREIPGVLLKTGLFSKIFMLLSYYTCKYFFQKN